MEVYKFGGASVKDADGIRNLGSIVKEHKGELLVVVSALGKTTNALENVVADFLEKGSAPESKIEYLESYHNNIIEELGLQGGVFERVGKEFSELNSFLLKTESCDYDFIYDQVVSRGEIWSTLIVDAWLRECEVDTEWWDIRKLLITDNRFRDANINWEESRARIKQIYSGRKSGVVVTQGFIGGTDEAYSTTLGREGSDFTAGIMANILDAERVTVWKDVPGVMNADPEWMSGTQKLPVISYKEAVEMSFSGAKVIHPKTIKPLHNKGIPLIVRSFLNPSDPGTMISVNESIAQDVPLFIKKEKQVLVSLVPRDFSFVIGDNLGVLFQRFYEKGVKINLVQTSAVSVAVSVDEDIMKLNGLIAVLSEEYKVLVNRNVELITLRYYSDEAIKRVTSGREVLLEQRTRRSIRYVLG